MIDILRTQHGAEIYIDGELVEPGVDTGENMLEHHVFRKHVTVVCDDEAADCEKHVDGEIRKFIVIEARSDTED